MNQNKIENRIAAVAGAAWRTVPNAFHALGAAVQDLASVTGSAPGDITATDLRGCWVMIQNASGGDLTLLRGTASGMTAPTAGQGKIIKDGTTEEFFVASDDPDHFIKGSATGLVLLYDTKLAKAA